MYFGYENCCFLPELQFIVEAGRGKSFVSRSYVVSFRGRCAVCGLQFTYSSKYNVFDPFYPCLSRFSSETFSLLFLVWRQTLFAVLTRNVPLLLCRPAGVESHIVVLNASAPTGNYTIFESVPIAWHSNPLTFPNVSGLLVLANQTQTFLEQFREKFPDSPYPPPLIIVDLYPGYRRPYVENRIVTWARQHNPVAAVFLGGTFYTRKIEFSH